MPVGLPGLLARSLLGKLQFGTHAFTYSQLQLFRPSVRAFQLVPTGTAQRSSSPPFCVHVVERRGWPQFPRLRLRTRSRLDRSADPGSGHLGYPNTRDTLFLYPSCSGLVRDASRRITTVRVLGCGRGRWTSWPCAVGAGLRLRVRRSGLQASGRRGQGQGPLFLLAASTSPSHLAGVRQERREARRGALSVRGRGRVGSGSRTNAVGG
jgi:hypothetical protein